MVAANPALGSGKPSMLQKARRRVLMRQATVAACEGVGERFRLITFEGPQLRNANWVAGQKVQIPLGASFATRTYTPIEWDAAAGRTRIVGYVQSNTPGGSLLSRATVGDRLDLLGPRQSLDATAVAGPIVVFGDETSVGLVCALQRSAPDRTGFYRLEVTDRGSVERVLHHLELSDVELCGREDGDRHLDLLEADLPNYCSGGATFVLTGRAPAIQRIRQALNRLEVPSTRIMTKAYWSPGKIGLD